jgi:hypothetical protein
MIVAVILEIFLIRYANCIYGTKHFSTEWFLAKLDALNTVQGQMPAAGGFPDLIRYWSAVVFSSLVVSLSSWRHSTFR